MRLLSCGLDAGDTISRTAPRASVSSTAMISSSIASSSAEAENQLKFTVAEQAAAIQRLQARITQLERQAPQTPSTSLNVPVSVPKSSSNSCNPPGGPRIR